MRTTHRDYSIPTLTRIAEMVMILHGATATLVSIGTGLTPGWFDLPRSDRLVEITPSIPAVAMILVGFSPGAFGSLLAIGTLVVTFLLGTVDFCLSVLLGISPTSGALVKCTHPGIDTCLTRRIPATPFLLIFRKLTCLLIQAALRTGLHVSSLSRRSPTGIRGLLSRQSGPAGEHEKQKDQRTVLPRHLQSTLFRIACQSKDGVT